jgi:glutathione S-transferase
MRAKARWLEEYADSRMGEVFIWHYYNQLVIKRFVWGQQPDQYVLQQAIEQEIPEILNYLERTVPEEGFIFGLISIADIALSAFFRNLFFARYRIDRKRWPKTSDFVTYMHQQPMFKKLMPYEEISLSTTIIKHREKLLKAGAPLTVHSFATPTPRQGIMQT